MRWPLVLVLSFAGCVAAKAEPVSTPGAAAPAGGASIGVEVKIRGPMGFPTYDADTVLFVRQCDAEPDCKPTLIPTRFAKKGRAYLLDVPPGRYFAVAAMIELGGATDRYFVYFPQSVIDATQSDVTASSRFVAAGSYVLGMSQSLCPDVAEPQQLAYAEQVEPATKKCGLVGSVVDKVARSGPVFIGGMAIPSNALLYHYRGVARESQRQPADVERLERQAATDRAEYDSKR